jgi:hypothetical protein
MFSNVFTGISTVFIIALKMGNVPAKKLTTNYYPRTEKGSSALSGDNH